jgi:hypothetical protein
MEDSKLEDIREQKTKQQKKFYIVSDKSIPNLKRKLVDG